MNLDLAQILKLPVHPAADVFPLLDDDELSELANDIAENGLRSPLVIGTHEGQTVLIDGRNRRRACELVKAEPTWIELNADDDPVAYILSTNINRRHMTKGQRAMAVARISPETRQGKRRTSEVSSEVVSAKRVQQARMVIKYAPDLADAVLSGSTSLDQAYKQAQDAKAASESRDSVFADLKAARPDLADQVIEGRLTLEAAVAARRADDDTARVKRTALARNLSNLRLLPQELATEKHIDHVAELLIVHPDEFQAASGMSVKEFLQTLKSIKSQCDSLSRKVGVA